MNTDTYKIPAANMAKLQTRIDKLNKKCRKVNVAEATLTVVDTVTTYEIINELWGTKRKRVFKIVEITGVEAPKFAGWSFLGTIDHKTKMVNAVPGQSIPQEYWTRDGVCDHCKTNRRRRETFVVQHDDGRTKQVGRQCVADFLGHKDAMAIASACTWLADFAVAMGDPDSEWYGGRPVWDFSLVGVLKVTSAYIRRHGWTPRSSAGTTPATADSVFQYIADPKGVEEYKKWNNGADLDYRDSDTETANAAIEWVKTQDGNANEYIHNLQTIVELDTVSDKTIGYACSIVSSYLRATERELKFRNEKAKTANSVHIGTIKERREFTLTVDGVYWTESNWGSVGIFRMHDADGNAFTWFATSDPELVKDGTYRIKATVKKHDEYKGTKQTILTRCTVLENTTDHDEPGTPADDDSAGDGERWITRAECTACNAKVDVDAHSEKNANQRAVILRAVDPTNKCAFGCGAEDAMRFFALKHAERFKRFVEQPDDRATRVVS